MAHSRAWMPHRVLAALTVSLLMVSAPAPATVENTPHNLARDMHIPTDPGSGAVCIFCHTPRGRDGAPVSPLWLRDVDREASSFVTFDTLGISGPPETRPSVGAVSLACLSCHDGAQAFGVGNSSPQSIVRISPAEKVRIGGVEITAAPATTVVESPSLSGEEHHPVGIPYARAQYNGADEKTPEDDREKPREFRRPESAIINAVKVWWIDTGGFGRSRTDIPLFTRFRDEDGTAVPYVECPSCHDPHSEAKLFLRVDWDGKGLCLACHQL